MLVGLHVKSQRKLECLCSSFLLLRSFNSLPRSLILRPRNFQPESQVLRLKNLSSMVVHYTLSMQVKWRRRDHKMPDGQDTIQGTSIHFRRVTRSANIKLQISWGSTNTSNSTYFQCLIFWILGTIPVTTSARLTMALGTVQLPRKSGLKFTVSLYFVLFGEIFCERDFIPHSFVMPSTTIFPFFRCSSCWSSQ